MLASIVLIVSGAPLTVVKAQLPKSFGTGTDNVRLSAEDKELTVGLTAAGA